MFERFTERSRQVVVHAQSEARSLKHDYIGTEHILLGLLREDEGLAARVLESLDITLEEVRADVVRVVGEGPGEVTSGQIPFTPRAKKVLELALREALAVGDNYIGTEHILLGLVRENDGVAARILVDLGTDAEQVRNEVLRVISRPRGRRKSYVEMRSRPSRPQTPWAYRVERLPAGDVSSEQLDALGAAGWELVAGVPSGHEVVLFLKRRADQIFPEG